MIQDIAPYVLDNSYRPVQPQANSIILYFEKRSVLVAEGSEGIRFPLFGTFGGDQITRKPVYLFSIGDDHFFLAMELSGWAPEYRLTDINLLRTAVPRHLAFAGLTAFGLYSWYSSHIFCSRCGSQMEHHDRERMMFCPVCSHMEYPKISPAVIVAVTHGDKLLMSRYANREYTRYALLAGFSEVGESIEETVRREVMEEVGLGVKNLRYYKSQPWAFSESLLLGFFAELDGSDRITLDEDELEEAQWFDRKDIPASDSDISLTSDMIEYFRNGYA